MLDPYRDPRSLLEPLIRKLGAEIVANRVRIRALLELLEERGLLAPQEFDTRAEQVWQRDFDSLSAELCEERPWEEASGLESKSDEEICQECGALCCRSACIVLTPQEAELLPRRAEELSVRDLEIVAERGQPPPIMLAFPCPFLNGNNCLIYEERPVHCQQHPQEWREECPLSWVRYQEGTNLPRTG